MILEIDAGNTFIKWRVMDARHVLDRGKFLTQSESWPPPESWNAIESILVASVAGTDINQKITEYFAALDLVPVFASTQTQQAGVTNSYQDPSRMGVDRWLVMLAAYNDCNSACCIVDCGSAITVDFVDHAGQHQGGYIIPGLRLMNGSLQQNTAEVLVDQTISGFDQSPGINTSQAVIHGVNYLFDSLVQKVVAEVSSNEQPCKLYITGGDGELFSRLAGEGVYVPDLVLDGLALGIE